MYPRMYNQHFFNCSTFHKYFGKNSFITVTLLYKIVFHATEKSYNTAFFNVTFIKKKLTIFNLHH